MALYVWLFECARCHQCVLVCTRCLGGRRYCDPCREQVRAESVRKSGSQYQKTPNGRRNHMLRQRRLRACCREGLQAGQEPTGSPPGSACTAGIGPSEAVAPASSSPAVTHQSVRLSTRGGAKLIRAPELAAYVAAVHDADGDGHEAQRPAEGTATTVAGKGETTSPICQWDRVPRTQAADHARQAAAAALAQLRHRGPRGPPIVAACCCCGRRGELVAYEGQPRIIRGCEHGSETG